MIAAPPGVVPLPRVNITAAQVNTADPQFAKQEAALIGSLTTVALGKLGVPTSFAAVLGS